MSSMKFLFNYFTSEEIEEQEQNILFAGSDLDAIKEFAFSTKELVKESKPFMFMGLVEGIHIYKDQKNKEQRLYFFRCESPTKPFYIMVFGFQSMNTNFDKKELKKGDYIKFKYNGLKEQDKGDPFYSCFIDKKEQ